jgi:AcrR family transcriptional regulator
VEALTIRRLADELGIKPMTIYDHVPSKEAILDGLLDFVSCRDRGADAYPRMVEFTRDHVLRLGYSFGASFEFGLDLLLDALAVAAQAERGTPERGHDDCSSSPTSAYRR